MDPPLATTEVDLEKGVLLSSLHHSTPTLHHASSHLGTSLVEGSQDVPNDSLLEASDIEAPPVPQGPTLAGGRPPNRNQARGRYFGMGKGTRSHQQVGANIDDYEQKYPDDERGEELGPSARFYRVYIDEHEKYRFELVEGWKDNLDVLLVFAGLFSAVVTTFVVEASKSLQPDYAQFTTTLLVQHSMILSQMLAMQKGTPINDTSLPAEVDMSFTASNNARWVNGLWFTSLALALSTALIAVVAKQWLQSYMVSPVGTPQSRGRLFHLRFISLEKWRVAAIIGMLPFLLHLSLLLFFCGLVVYILPNDRVIGIVVGSIALACYLAYAITTFLPVVVPTCSYKTPLSQLIYSLLRMLILLTFSPFESFMRDIYISHDFYLFDKMYRAIYNQLIPSIKPSLTLVHREQALLTSTRESPSEFACNIDHQMITWMHSFSFSPSATSITLQALCALTLSDTCQLAREVKADLKRELQESFSGKNMATFKPFRLLGATLAHAPWWRGNWRNKPGFYASQVVTVYDGVFLDLTTWTQLLRHGNQSALCLSLVLLAWNPEMFGDHWRNSTNLGNGLKTIRNIILNTDGTADGQAERQSILKALCCGSSWHLYSGPTSALSAKRSQVDDEFWGHFDLQALAFIATIWTFEYPLLFNDVYPRSKIVTAMDQLARKFCAVLQGDSYAALSCPSAKDCAYLLRHVPQASDKIPELAQYVQEQLALYNTQHFSENGEESAE